MNHETWCVATQQDATFARTVCTGKAQHVSERAILDSVMMGTAQDSHIRHRATNKLSCRTTPTVALCAPVCIAAEVAHGVHELPPGCLPGWAGWLHRSLQHCCGVDLQLVLSNDGDAKLGLWEWKARSTASLSMQALSNNISASMRQAGCAMGAQ